MSKTIFQKWKRPVLLAGFCCMAVSTLQGCVGLIVGSAVVGTFAATDRRTLGAQTEDKAIAIKGESRLNRAFGDAAHINVNTFNRRVLLTGEVADEKTREVAEREVRAIENVQVVSNEIQIAPLANFSARSNDLLLTTKVRASFVDTKDLYGRAFKIVSEAGVVYLLGRVTEREGQLAGEVAAGVSGVRKVVKIFDYITEEELKGFLSTPIKNESADELKDAK